VGIGLGNKKGPVKGTHWQKRDG